MLRAGLGHDIYRGFITRIYAPVWQGLSEREDTSTLLLSQLTNIQSFENKIFSDKRHDYTYATFNVPYKYQMQHNNLIIKFYQNLCRRE